ncbi:hypothetical protein AB0F77_03460 [Streptomyces sp. NPDC026672]|uniref:P-loop NTPase n=1 Tax=unclassified Streptomyces TaxID=2593676 RepID=UPI0033E77D70
MPTATVEWPPWRDGDGDSLARYALPDEVAAHAALPADPAQSTRTRLRGVWDALRAVGVGYTVEPPGQDRAQLVRTPAEVLDTVRSATCLDLALVLAAACVYGGLPASVLVVEPTGPGRPRHALVAVALGSDRPDRAPGFWTGPPETVAAAVRAALTGPPRPLAVLDPVGLTRPSDSSRALGTGADVEEALATGRRHLLDGRWRVTTVAECRRRADAHRPPATPAVAPLRAPFRAPETSESALRLMRAEYRLTPFLPRDELVVLDDLCAGLAPGDPTGLTVLSGRGGAGKTRLALELADRLTRKGWRAGVLRERIDDPLALGSLAAGGAPLLVVVDYADARVDQTTALLRALRHRTAPTAVVLAARTTRGDWHGHITGSLTGDGHPYTLTGIELPQAHPASGEVYRRTFATVSGRPAASAPPVPAPAWATVWTTLDLVLLGWLAGTGARRLPDTPHALYDQVLQHESRYWRAVFARTRGRRRGYDNLLDEAAACLTLLSPPTDLVDTALRAVTRLERTDDLRAAVAGTMTACLAPGPGEAVAIRPDPVGDHHLLTWLRNRPDLVRRCLDLASTPALDPELDPVETGAGGEPVQRALTVLARAGQNDADAEDTAAVHIEALLRASPGVWPLALAVAAAGGGPVRRVLEECVTAPDCPFPPAELAEALPFQPGGLWRLALLADERQLTEARSGGAEPHRLADLLLRVGHRRSDAGDRAGALRAARQATALFRRLLAHDPAHYGPRLALALNHVSTFRAAAGDPAGALEAITEAVRRYAELAAADPEAHRADHAGALINLSSRAEEAAEFDRALAAAEQATLILRELTAGDPETHGPTLALALVNLTLARRATGDRAGALAAAEEAEDRYRELADADPHAYRPLLASALNNLGSARADNGDPAGGVRAAEEVVRVHRELARVNPDYFRPELARSLGQLANRLADAGDDLRATGLAAEGLALLRELSATPGSPENSDSSGTSGTSETSGTSAPGIRHELMLALNGHSNRLAEQGDTDAALASAREAVGLGRALAAEHPAYLADLAITLNTLFAAHHDRGERAAALAAITEAADLGRRAYAQHPGSFDTDLAAILMNLAVALGESGAPQDASATASEAARIVREAAERAGPGALSEESAAALVNAATVQLDLGRPDEAAVSAADAVAIRRGPAAADPAAFSEDLAVALHTLFRAEHARGDVWAALAAATESAALFRDAAADGATRHRRNLADAQHVLALARAEAGDEIGALRAVADAVDTLRALAAAEPDRFGRGLADALTGLSNRLADADRTDEAVAAAGEAVDRLRALAEEDPEAHRAALYGALHSWAAHRWAGGDADALGPAEEALRGYEDLRRHEPSRYLPETAMCLNTVAGLRWTAGDRSGALTAADAAVAAHREAGRTGAHRADLAAALNNSGLWRLEQGDVTGAVALLSEAATIHRALTRQDAATRAPGLVRATLALCRALLAAGRRDRAARAWRQALTATPVAPHRAEVRASQAVWQHRQGARAAAVHSARRAAAEAEAAAPDTAPHLLGRVRRTVRGTVDHLGMRGAGLPHWATTAVTPELSTLVTALAEADGWDAAHTVLVRHRTLLTDPAAPAAATALAALFPGDSTAEAVRVWAGDIARTGFDAAVASLAEQAAAARAVSAWLAVTAPDAVVDHLEAHADELTTGAVLDLLAADPDHEARLAVLRLTERLTTDGLRDALADPDTAARRAFDDGDLDLLTHLASAVPDLLTRPGIGELTAAVLLVAHGLPDAGLDTGRRLAEESPHLRRRAYAVHLRTLATAAATEQDREAFTRLAALMEPDAPHPAA